MTKHHGKHSAGSHNDHSTSQRKLHKDWRTLVVVGLMLAGMAVYVLSGDESIQPGAEGEAPRVPAAP